MKKRKIVSILLSLLLILSGVSCVNIVNAEDSPQFVISSASGSAGDTVTVTVSTKNNPGVTSIKGKISYDKSLLTLTDVTYNSDFGGNTTQPQTLNVSPITVNWMNAVGPNCTLNTTFVTLTFKISESATPGSSSSITMTYDSDDVYNLDENNVSFEVVSGSVSVTGGDGSQEYSVKYNTTTGVTLPADGTAISGTDYIFNLPSEDNYTITLDKVTIGGKAYTGYYISGKVVTIPGTDISGDISITIKRTAQTIDEGASTITGESINVKPGDEVLYSVSLEGEQDLAGFKVFLDYDKRVFSLDYDETTSLYVVQKGSGLKGNGTLYGNVTNTGAQVLWYNAQNVSVTGCIVCFKLKVADDAAAGEYPITVRYSSADTVKLNDSSQSVEVPLVCSSGTVTVSDVSKASLSIESAEVVTGSTISLPVTLSNNSGFAGFTFVLSLPDGITLESITKGSLLSQNESGRFLAYESTGRINWIDSTNTSGDGELFVINLTVPQDLAAGKYEIGLTLLNSNAKNFSDSNGAAVPLTITNSELTVLDYMLGDVDNDRDITTADAIHMARYMVEAETFNTRQKSAADLDKDGNITSADCIKMSRYLVGIITTLE